MRILGVASILAMVVLTGLILLVKDENTYLYKDAVFMTSQVEQMKVKEHDLQHEITKLEAELKRVRNELEVSRSLTTFADRQADSDRKLAANYKQQVERGARDLSLAQADLKDARDTATATKGQITRLQQDYRDLQGRYSTLHERWKKTVDVALWNYGYESVKPNDQSVVLAKYNFDKTMANMEDIAKRTGHYYYFGNVGDVAIPMLYHLQHAHELKLVERNELTTRVERLARYVRSDDDKSLQAIKYIRGKLS